MVGFVMTDDDDDAVEIVDDDTASIEFEFPEEVVAGNLEEEE